MNLSATKSRLAAITKELSLQWVETKNYWRDSKSLEFEHRYIDELIIRMDKSRHGSREAGHAFGESQKGL